MSNSGSSSSGIGVGSLLTVAFVIMKLTDVIDWKWIWVLSPMWISAAIGLFVVTVIGGIIALLNR